MASSLEPPRSILPPIDLSQRRGNSLVALLLQQKRVFVGRALPDVSILPGYDVWVLLRLLLRGASLVDATDSIFILRAFLALWG